jgi:hypothetical protein
MMDHISKNFTTDGCDQLILEPEDWTEEQYAAFLKIFGLDEAERIVITDYKIEAYATPKLTDEEWGRAIKHLEFFIIEYASIGWPGQFALNGVLVPLRKRYESGERTRELYEAIMGLE